MYARSITLIRSYAKPFACVTRSDFTMDRLADSQPHSAVFRLYWVRYVIIMTNSAWLNIIKNYCESSRTHVTIKTIFHADDSRYIQRHSRVIYPGPGS